MQVDCARSGGLPSRGGHGGRERRWLAGVVMLAALLSLGSAAWRPALAAAAPIGTVFSTVLDLDGKQIPLPQGAWTLVGDGFEIVPSVRGGDGEAIESVVLFKIEGGSVAAFIIAHRNTIGIDKGWGTAGDCDRDDIHAAVTYDESGAHGFCGFVNHVVTAIDDRSAGSWRQAVAYAETHGLALAPTWLMAGFRLSDAADVIDVRYHFDPAIAGFSTPAALSGWSESKWSKAAVTGIPANEGWGDATRRWASYAAFWRSDTPAALSARAVAVDDLVAWLDTMRFPVELGFRNRAGDVAAVSMPWSKDRSELPADLTLRLQKLDQLRARNVLSREQYEEQRAIVESEHGGVAGGRWTAVGLTTAKAITNQITTNIAAFAANYWYTGNAITSLGLIGLHTVVDLGQYWSTEWLWNRFGPRRIDAVAEVDFTGAGIDRPSTGASPGLPLPEGGGLVLGHAPAQGDEGGQSTVTK
jgi:hypothetical protein